MVNTRDLIDDAKCSQTVWQMSWPERGACPHCSSKSLIKGGRDDTREHRQRYPCQACRRPFDDLTGTIFAGHHQPLRVWIICPYFMGLNLSSLRIAKELGMDRSDVQAMVQQLRQGIVDHSPAVALEGEVECDEAYVVAGHEGDPEAVEKSGKPGVDGV